MAKTVDPARVEQDARTRFADLDAAAPAARDDRGVEHAPGERYVDILRRARLIAISDGLADAVLARLAAAGVEAVTDRVRVDPAEDDRQVMAIAGTVGGTPAVVPLRPGGTTLRAYPAGPDTTLTGPPLVIVEGVAREPDGWVGAAAIADALAEHLR
ncbi:hypothetical protein [Saccharothrix australiensis]|uniref:Uncharacterized protein n=1 Tax=Saccharothrix australiensis TaxID=2072 RepID=A0A495VYP3_9PSEU|nr:hypothetical protein [Saccharothrix australiensis]RKT54369.1 hypothetical protein C8E97_2989 [Saccharothrix australiensis]